MAFYQALEISQVYISIPWVMASMGSALTAGYLEKRQVTKRLIPSIRCLAKARHAFTPALLRGPAAIGHPWPGAANPASCRVAHCARPAFSLWLTGQSRSKAQRPRRPYSRPGLGCTRSSVGVSLLAKAPSLLANFSKTPKNPVGAAVRRFDLPAMTFAQTLEILQVYISISCVMADIGSALTAGHFEKPKVTKGFHPLHSVPR